MNQAEEQLAAQRKANEAYHNSLPSLPWPTSLNPSGLVPTFCEHGIPEKPKEYPDTNGVYPRFGPDGGELPPYQGKTWIRAKYLLHMDAKSIDGKIVTYAPKCVVCLGQPAPDDLTTPADQC